VLAASQWLNTTAGRITTDPYSWMQAVHWVGGSGLYTPTSTHSPKWGATTVLIAQELSALTECRPGIEYLARKLKCSARTVKYHLGMLREAGLLVYRSKGTRITGGVRQASVYERVIPVEFDEALGIRTVGEGLERRPVGIAEEGRKLIGKLAKKAARKVRRPRRRTPVSGRGRCTPMQGGTSTVSSTGSTSSPSETELASGEADRPTPKKSNRGPRKLNKVGRRMQLASELISQVPWLGDASRPRISWIVRHVADAGWTALEVQAIAEQDAPLSAADVRRCSGMLAHRLKGVHLLYKTQAQRDQLVEHWRTSRTAERARHNGYENGLDGGSDQIVAQVVAGLFQGMARYSANVTAQGLDDLTGADAAADMAAFLGTGVPA
jgi:biotin operon repressor